MLFHHMKYVTHGFIGGVAVTASVCYSLFKFSPDKDGNVLLNARENGTVYCVDQTQWHHHRVFLPNPVISAMLLES